MAMQVVDRVMPRKASEPRERIDLRADAATVKRLQRQAERFTGGNLSAYIKIALIERLEKDEETDPRKKTKET